MGCASAGQSLSLFVACYVASRMGGSAFVSCAVQIVIAALGIPVFEAY